jgi:hypothetical protein
MANHGCVRVLLAWAIAAAGGCSGEVSEEEEPGPFVPELDDEAVDPEDPPIDPDPAEDDLEALSRSACPARARLLSPKGLTFVIHISKRDENGWDALRQLRDVRHLLRARDVFMIERRSPVVQALREEFPCNEIHFIAYPEELANAYDNLDIVDGIAVDWEKSTFSNPQSYSVDKLRGYADKIHDKGKSAGVVPYWPKAFDDGHIVAASRMDYDLAQIQDHCARSGPTSFAGAARNLIESFRANGLRARDLGVEISLNSYASADNHTGVDLSARCARKAYGKGARAIYLYGNGQPHLGKFFRRMAAMGLRVPR